jgi:RimJ/RimL family protein N-acetyltransferase
LFIAIAIKDTGKMIGTMSVHCNIRHETADVGIMLGDRDFWGKGLGKISWDVLIKRLIDKCSVRKVTGGTLACNHSMVKIMIGTGMQEDGIRRAQELVDGQAFDMVHYAKFL